MSYDPVTLNPGHYRIILQGILKKRFYFTHTYIKKRILKVFFFFISCQLFPSSVAQIFPSSAKAYFVH